ncbi:hypothetical protein CYY_000218 [Polysphondylium violaceum]|uniref:Uncharacterized protein n=1 Tax=Polysphondylium violaceum TaxID=133409 RepID=A0A8J4Q054_9MYCE|nr:hypothetical protein CYY_000218 [Polysphondylium violaceum]
MAEGLPISVSLESDGTKSISGLGCFLPSPTSIPKPCFLMVTSATFQGDEGFWRDRKLVRNLVIQHQGRSYSLGSCRIDVRKHDFDHDNIHDYRINVWPDNPISESPSI